MSDNIEFNKAKDTHSAFSLKLPMWHAKGTVVNEAKTAKEVIEIANLGYTVRKGRVFIQYEDKDQTVLNAKGIAVDNTYVTYRTDNGMPLMNSGHAVTKSYTVIQNIEAFDFFDRVIGDGLAVYETAGVLGNGEKVFVTCKLPDFIKLNGNDIIDKYLLFTNSHDGSDTLTVMITPIRVVCNNTLNMALSTGANKLKIKHTASAKDKLISADKVLGLSNTYYAELEHILNDLGNIQVNAEQVHQFVTGMTLKPEEAKIANELIAKTGGYTVLKQVSEISTEKVNQIVLLDNVIHHGIGQDMYKNTGLWLYNGTTCYIQNHLKYKDDTNKIASVTTGFGYKLQQRAVELINSNL